MSLLSQGVFEIALPIPFEESSPPKRPTIPPQLTTSNLLIHPSRKCLVSDGTTECRSCNESGLTIGVLYSNEVDYLAAILKDWTKWSNDSKQALEFVIVDDGSDLNRSAPVIMRQMSTEAVIPTVRVLTVLDNLEWNIGGARNLLMHNAKHCSVVLLDNDYILPESLALELRGVNPDGVIYRLKRNHPGKSDVHPGIMYTQSSTYFEIGGADEDFVGHYGSTDPHIVWRAGKHGVPVMAFDSNARLQPQSITLSRPDRVRDNSVNSRLFGLKKKGTIPWSTSYLRFRSSDFTDITQHMTANPQRAHFADLFLYGGMRSGAEIGVASGRFSEHIIKHGSPDQWIMVEPYPNQNLASRLPRVRNCTQYTVNSVREEASTSWEERGIGQNTNITFLPHFSLQEEVLSRVPLNSLDFVYLDGAHDYTNVKAELEPWFNRVRPGGILAGHDYQHSGSFTPLACKNCQTVPMAQAYTEYGIAHGKSRAGSASSQAGVVRAVQEWMVESHPELIIHFTQENFTRESLEFSGFDFDLVITNTRNPSWYFMKPSPLVH